MTRGARPGWRDDPEVEAGFAAAYAPVPVAVPAPDRTPVQIQVPAPDGGASRPASGGRRTAGRAVSGAAVAVGGVCLGIAALLLVNGEPAGGPTVDGAGPLAVLSAPVATDPAQVDPSPVPPSPAAPPGPAVPPSPAASPPTRARAGVVPLVVLNNSTTTGLADRAARRFERNGWPVRRTGNFGGRVPVTTVYYDPGLEASARAFARDFREVVRVRPRFATLPARGVVVVLTRDYAD